MKWIFAIAMAVFLGGCATDRLYEAGKIIYIAGKRVVVANWGALPPDVKEKLKKIDGVAKRYDGARAILRPAIREALKETNMTKERK